MEKDKEKVILDIVSGAYNGLASGIVNNTYALKHLDNKTNKLYRHISQINKRCALYEIAIASLCVTTYIQRARITKIEKLLEKKEQEKETETNDQKDKK
jgi:hypothetical protein